MARVLARGPGTSKWQSEGLRPGSLAPQATRNRLPPLKPDRTLPRSVLSPPTLPTAFWGTDHRHALSPCAGYGLLAPNWHGFSALRHGLDLKVTFLTATPQLCLLRELMQVVLPRWALTAMVSVAGGSRRGGPQTEPMSLLLVRADLSRPQGVGCAPWGRL